MKLSAIALDYDGTTARDDVMGPQMRAAITAAQAAGVPVLLVTGRILSELRRVAGDLTFLDGVVAENGAVLHFPRAGHTTLLAPPVIGGFLDELRRLRVPHDVGQCLVDAGAHEADALLGIIRRLELPLVLLFNGGRVMTLSQGVSKATGLQVMLRTLRVSPRNTLAVGDAENDHELLRLAEVGAAVEWGSTALKAAADVVIPGVGPPAVADYLQAAVAQGSLPVPARGRRRLYLGYTRDGREFSLAIRGRNVLVSGDARSGKSWIAGLLCEQLILHGYSVCVVDPEGDYCSLEALPGVTVLGGEGDLPSHRQLLQALRYPDRSLVLDLSQQPQDQKIEYIRALLPLLNGIRRETGLPHRIVVDEAHYFLHDAAAAAAQNLLDLENNGYTFVTYAAASLPAELLQSTEVMIVTHQSDAAEVEALRRWCPARYADDEGWAGLRRLAPGQAVALPVTEESDGALIQFTLGPRLTRHVRHRQKYIDVPVTDRKAFVFPEAGLRRRCTARTLREFVTELGARHDHEGYLARGDFSRWIADVFGDHVLAAELRDLESRHRLQPSAATVPGIVSTITARYELTE